MKMLFKSLECPFNAHFNTFRSLKTSNTVCRCVFFFPHSLQTILIFTVHVAKFTDEGSSGMYVVLEKKSWIEAQTYCRLKNGELASVMNQTENEALQQVLDENGPLSSSVWIGLFRDAWEWSDHSDNSFRYWHSSQPNNDGICTVYHISYDSWFDRDCASSRPFYCYNGEQHVCCFLLCYEEH